MVDAHMPQCLCSKACVCTHYFCVMVQIMQQPSYLLSTASASISFTSTTERASFSCALSAAGNCSVELTLSCKSKCGPSAMPYIHEQLLPGLHLQMAQHGWAALHGIYDKCNMKGISCASILQPDSTAAEQLECAGQVQRQSGSLACHQLHGRLWLMPPTASRYGSIAYGPKTGCLHWPASTVLVRRAEGPGVAIGMNASGILLCGKHACSDR